jgi:hypothetical protein
MTNEERYAELTERMREIERIQDNLEPRYVDGHLQRWNLHMEIRRTPVTQQALDAILSILEGK